MSPRHINNIVRCHQYVSDLSVNGVLVLIAQESLFQEVHIVMDTVYRMHSCHQYVSDLSVNGVLVLITQESLFQEVHIVMDTVYSVVIRFGK